MKFQIVMEVMKIKNTFERTLAAHFGLFRVFAVELEFRLQVEQGGIESLPQMPAEMRL